MRMTSNTILVTGGGSGIGLALARRFVARGNSVIACGRRRAALAAAAMAVPGLITRVADVATEAGRLELVAWATNNHPALNVLINNAGIQNRPKPLTAPQDWAAHRQELATNLEAPMHLSMLLVKHLAARTPAVIINVTSGLAFAPIAAMPTYCLTKAALHSFTLSLRHQLRDTGIGVVEVAPPAVDTDLGGKGLHTFGVPLDAFADHAMAMLEVGELEFGYQSSEGARKASRTELDEAFARMNAAR